MAQSVDHKGRITVLLSSRLIWRCLLFVNVVLLLYFFIIPRHAVTRSKEAIKAYVSAGSHDSSVAEVEDRPEPVDWSQFAYCQYVTNLDYLCNSLMIFDSLVRVGAKADRLMMYPEQWTVDSSTHEGKLLMLARDTYGVSLAPITVERLAGDPTWSESFTKLLAFNQTQYKRVLSLDSDATVLQSMDELFLLPSAAVAMPRAYWAKDHILSSQLVLVEPSATEFSRIQAAFAAVDGTEYDMEIVNHLYGDSCIVIPHRKYDLITGEFRGINHSKYLGSEEEEWNAKTILAETKFLHFSDWPLPKPWRAASEMMIKTREPTCREIATGHNSTDIEKREGTHVEGDNQDEGVQGGDHMPSWDCSDQEVWRDIYEDFRVRRERVCGDHFKVENYR